MNNFLKSCKLVYLFPILVFLLIACTCNGATLSAINQNKTASTEEINNQTADTITTNLQDSTPISKTKTNKKPFDLIGIWKCDDMRAPDNSWNISYSIYLKFTNTRQYVYHGIETFNNDRSTDESDIVYLNESTLIKKMVYIPDHQEYLGKYQKWTWRLSNGNVLFTIYEIVDSQDLSLSDKSITALATGVKVK
jgi:hypothetical protein